MIKINLLPYRAQRKRQALQNQLVIGVIPLALTLICIAVAWWSISADISAADQETVRYKQEIEKQKETLKEIETFKAKKEVIKQKMGVIQTLQKGKSGPVHMLDDLATNLPGRLWLTDFTQKEMQLEIKGRAMDNISISNYMINLEKSPYFTTVDLKEIKTNTKRSSKGVQLKDFVITCNVTYSTDTTTDAPAETKADKKTKAKREPKASAKAEDQV